jgi:hypothetical protein
VTAPPGANPMTAAQSAVVAAAKQIAPGLLQPGVGAARHLGRTGRWVRQGRNIIIVNCQPR